MSRPVVVSDAGPLIALAACGHLELLIALFDAVHVPQVVLGETTADRSRPGVAQIQAFGEIHAQVHPSRHDAVYEAAISHLDEGAAQALSLARALGCAVLMDERRGPPGDSAVRRAGGAAASQAYGQARSLRARS